MFFKNLSLRMQFSHVSVVQEDQTIYIFFFLKWRENIRFQAQTDTGVNGNFTFIILYLFSSVLFCFKKFSNGQGNGALKK